MTLVLGIDPGLANLGWCIMDSEPSRPVILGIGVVKTPPGETQPRVEAIVAVLEGWPWRLMVVEEQERAWQGMQKKRKTSSKATLARVGEGAARTLAAVRKARVIEVAPQTLRARLGLPRGADKHDLAARIRLSVIGLGKVSEHASDAAANAYIGVLEERLRNAKVKGTSI